MPPTFDDLACFDGIEPVTYVSVANSGNTNISLPTALQMPVSNKERMASGGVYTGQDVQWSLRLAELGNVKPKPADKIIDGSGTTWVVLEVKTSKFAQAAWCICRDLIIANQLYDSIDIQRPANTIDSSGKRVPSYSPVYTSIPGRLQELDGQREIEFDKAGFKRRYALILSQQVTVTTEDQCIVNGTDTYQIRSYKDPSRIDELMQLEVEKLP